MILKGAAQIIIASDSYKKTLLERYVPKKYRNEIEEKIKVIPYGINDFYIDNKFESRKKLRNEVNVLSIGRVDKNKNHILICKALKKEKSLGKKINLKIIGEGKNKKIVKKINKYPFVQYYSYMDKKELLRQYRKSDIFILTSKTETFGLVYAEALSQGLPIIYTQDQGFDKQLPEGLVGYHTSGRVRQLRKDFLKVIENYDKLQKNCVKATERFEWKNINVQYLNIYEDILK